MGGEDPNEEEQMWPGPVFQTITIVNIHSLESATLDRQ